MSGVLDAILTRARSVRARVVLPEGGDSRIREAASRAQSEGIAQIILIGGAPLDVPGASHVDPETDPRLDAYVDAYVELRKHRGATHEDARRILLDPLAFAGMMVRMGDADGSVAGAASSSAAVLRIALQVLREKDKTPSSFFLMVPPGDDRAPLLFADCALNIDPDAAQLANIGESSAESYAALTGETARTAMLSFSTYGSADHERARKMAEAATMLRDRRPDLIVDGELQFDAAIVPAVAASKAPGSAVNGQANVFIFPSLEAANIGYKIAQRLGGWAAIGPVTQGLTRPANDLSRGCSADDAFYTIALTSVQAGD